MRKENEQALVCLSNRDILESRRQPFHCKTAKNRCVLGLSLTPTPLGSYPVGVAALSYRGGGGMSGEKGEG